MPPDFSVIPDVPAKVRPGREFRAQLEKILRLGLRGSSGSVREGMTLETLGENKRAAILAIAAKHGVQRVRVFGSFARGDARAD
jgi:predicted nucleotidyltransferase